MRRQSFSPVRPFVRLFVCYQSCESDKRKNRFCCKLAQLVGGASRWNDQLWGSEGQRSRLHDAAVKFGGQAEAQLSTPWSSRLSSSMLWKSGYRPRKLYRCRLKKQLGYWNIPSWPQRTVSRPTVRICTLEILLLTHLFTYLQITKFSVNGKRVVVRRECIWLCCVLSARTTRRTRQHSVLACACLKNASLTVNVSTSATGTTTASSSLYVLHI